jgi:hypothetical protein
MQLLYYFYTTDPKIRDLSYQNEGFTFTLVSYNY